MKNDCWDVAVIGGGISGLGIAREAAQRGHRTILFEKARCCQSTSANSLRIIHGGFRYLQSFDFPRVIESLRAQAALRAHYPDLIDPLPCVLPLKPFGLKSRFPLFLAGVLYRLLGLCWGVRAPKTRIIGGGAVAKEVPVLREAGRAGLFEWHDAQLLQPDRLAQTIIGEITALKGKVLEESSVTKVEKSEGQFRIVTHSRNNANQGDTVLSKRVINASGPWLSEIELDFPRPNSRHPHSWCKAFNLVIRKPLDPQHGIGLESKQGRLFFATPRGAQGAIGTWYIPYQDEPSRVEISEEEIEAALIEFSSALPDFKLQREDVLEVEAGVLPSRGPLGKTPVPYGREQIYSSGGYTEVLSTKFTTFETQAKRVLQVVESGN